MVIDSTTGSLVLETKDIVAIYFALHNEKTDWSAISDKLNTHYVEMLATELFDTYLTNKTIQLAPFSVKTGVENNA
jgi:hypothetical protein